MKKEPFSEMETMDFAEYGKRQLALHSHEEVYSPPGMIGKQIRTCEFRYEVILMLSVCFRWAIETIP